MASLAGEQLPATNGVNGHSDALSTAPPVALSPTPLKPVEPTDVTDLSTVIESSNRNAASFVANASAPSESAPAEPSAEKPAADAAAQAAASPAAAAAEPAASPALDQDPAAATPDAAKHSPADATSEVAAKNERPAESALDSVPASALAEAAEPAPASLKPAADLPESPAPTPEAQPEPESAPEPTPAMDTKPESQEDVDMIDAASETLEGASFDSTKVASSEKYSTPGTSAASSHAHHASSLLPSLRDDPAVSAGDDSSMADAQPAKVARAREDDEEQGPLAKRAKTEDLEEASAPTAAATSTGTLAASARPAENGAIAVNTGMPIDMAAFVVPPRVRPMAKEGSLGHPDVDVQPISEYANREIRRVLASVKKTKAGGNFKDPVHKKWPMLWEAYTARVSKPVDIGMLERNLRDKVYANHGEFNNDVFLIFENSVLFNGLGNTITEEARVLVDNFFARLSDVPAREPQKADKKESKAQPTRHTEPRGTAARRESRGAAVTPIEDVAASGVVATSPTAAGVPAGAGAGAASPGAAAPAAAHADTAVFAVPSSGVPIIRRDSAKNDGDRPKRPIHPPKNRDLGYEPKNTKKKQPEFRFCEEVLKELMKAKHYEINHWFLRPVDPVAMQIPTYHKVIKKPMDLGTMQTKLNLGEYASAKDFENDLQLIVKNCRKFNIEGEVVNAADRLEDLFKEKWAEKDSWVAAHTVVSPSAVKGDDSDSELDDSDDDLDDGSLVPLSSDTVDALVKRLEEEYDRLNKLLMVRVPDMTVIVTQQVVTNMLQKQIVEEKTKLAAAEASRRNSRAARKAGKKKTLGGARKSGGGGVGGGGGGVGAGGKKAAVGAGAVSKKPKPRVLGQAEKNVVTDGINNLSGVQLEKAIDIIKKDTHQEESEEGELELDIDQLSQDALGKLYDLVVRNFPAMRIKAEKKAPAVDAAGLPVGKPSKPKKHKPMGKLEQERNIEKLREIKAQFQRPGSGSQEPIPSVELGQVMEAEESEEESDVDSEEE